MIPNHVLVLGAPNTGKLRICELISSRKLDFTSVDSKSHSGLIFKTDLSTKYYSLRLNLLVDEYPQQRNSLECNSEEEEEEEAMREQEFEGEESMDENHDENVEDEDDSDNEHDNSQTDNPDDDLGEIDAVGGDDEGEVIENHMEIPEEQSSHGLADTEVKKDITVENSPDLGEQPTVDTEDNDDVMNIDS
mmetsp:Transcript_4746/g.5758  ORF Transcript_4746/g.5758 Transcript_4746/m.5758 type:complete len:191 (-) Transcript_4746:6402-6974(-)